MGVHGGEVARCRLMLVGPLPTDRDPVGGTKVSFQQLVRYFEGKPTQWSVSVVSTSRQRQGKNVIARAWTACVRFFRILCYVSRNMRSHDLILFNISPGAFIRSGPVFWLLLRLGRRPITFRLFGGSLDLFLAKVSRWQRMVLEKTALRSTLFVQTRSLVRSLAPRQNVHWLPTARDLNAISRSRTEKDRAVSFRVLFIGQLRLAKGIGELLEAIDRCHPAVVLDVYGPMFDEEIRDLLAGSHRTAYHGPIPSTEVAAVMAEHDVLVFPSYYEGEGYPGVIIEAFQAGLPVIATRWRAIPELFDAHMGGLLIEPGDSAELGVAIERLRSDSDLYRAVQTEAKSAGELFREPAVYSMLEDVLRNLCKSSCAA